MKKSIYMALKPSFILSAEDKKFLTELPDNLPGASLKESQKQTISSIYRKYITQNQVYAGWGLELYELEKKEKWPSGPRVKDHEAKRFVLGWLLHYNDKQQMTAEDAAKFLHATLTCREADRYLISHCYEIKN